jgi:two-component system sensor histidine kinase KdpD
VLEPTNLVMVFLAAVLVSGLYLGRGPSVVASILSVLAFDFLFVAPRFSLTVANSQDILTFFGLFVVGIVTSSLTAQVREEVEAGRRREVETAALYALSRDLTVATALDSILATINRHIAGVFQRQSIIVLAEDGRVVGEDGDALSAVEWAAAKRAFGQAQPATDPLPSALRIQQSAAPLRTARGTLGVLVVRPSASADTLDHAQISLLAAFASVAALAIERAQLAEAARQSEMMKITEQLQAALLNSVSHDLRTPLSSISGVLTTLEDDVGLLNPAARRSLVQTAREEADRLNRLVGDLLDMSRLEAGALRVDAQPCDVEDLVGSALARLGRRLDGRLVQVDVPAATPLVMADFVLIVHALVNILDNAIKYSPPGEPIGIAAQVVGEMVHVSVRDCGAGIPDADLARIFDKFHRVQRSDGMPGTGLGLSITKGIVEAHGGRIWARNRREGGAVISLSLPIERPATAGTRGRA